MIKKNRQLHGLLLDLEYALPDPSRHSELASVMLNELKAGPGVELTYCHFTEFTLEAATKPDFILLSPQGTPWRNYSGEARDKLSAAMNVLKKTILVNDKPVIGICGGHQFLAMAFGGQVDYMDTNFAVNQSEKYPRNALSERGVVRLEILGPDPIFRGVSTGAFRAIESHYEEVKNVPERFVNLARSPLSEVQLLRLSGKMVYGMAFHPERCLNEHNECEIVEGRRMLANFIEMVASKQ
jgi:GMP synthase (glutamine-hydrolysing)